MLEDYIRRHKAWSLITFGDGKKTKSICNHIRKELLEIEAEPEVLEEWIDVIILGLDGAWRTGAREREIVAAMEAKQQVNQGRRWVKPAHEDDPTEHDRDEHS